MPVQIIAYSKGRTEELVVKLQVHYYAVMTGAEDRWKVRVLESTAK